MVLHSDVEIQCEMVKLLTIECVPVETGLTGVSNETEYLTISSITRD